MRKEPEYKIDAGQHGLFCYSTKEAAERRFVELSEKYPHLSISLIELTPEEIRYRPAIKTFECTQCTPKCSLTVSPMGMDCSLPRICPWELSQHNSGWKEVENEK